MNSISRFAFYTGIHVSPRQRLALMALLLLAVCYEIFDSGLSRLFFGPAVEIAESGDEIGFRPVECWFSAEEDWPESDCYYMQVPEAHGQPDGRIISFPVVIFHANALLRYKNPVLHLGAGGPGSPMQLNSAQSMGRVWRYFSHLSIDQGRDLYVIDPRGSGLAQPSLVCRSAIDKSIQWLGMDLTFTDESNLLREQYTQCIREYQEADVDLSKYNSVAVAHDMELMRQKSNVDKWVLYGVSYATLYAQVFAQKTPSRVEAMVLDSSVMVGRTGDKGFIKRMRAPYELMRRQCRKDEVCSGHPRSFMERIGVLHRKFNDDPLTVDTKNPYTNKDVEIVLNGDRLLSVFLIAMYYESFVSEVVSIVQDVERGEFESLDPYVKSYVAFALDGQYGDISMEAHYCQDTKPFFDHEQMRTKVDQELRGVARYVSLASLEYGDHCDLIGSKRADPVLEEGKITRIPTLFLHGDLDTVTPVDDVIAEKHLYKNSKLVRFNVAHSVFEAHECAHYAAAWFVDNPEIPKWRLYCQR